MGVTKLSRSILVSIILLGPVMWSNSNAESPNVTVSVTGTGLTLEDAKSDAIRQALQITLRQLVVVDRAVSGDRVLRDKVMSTVNGYIERYEQKRASRAGGEFTVEASVTVSASRIENYIGTLMGAGGIIRGGSLLDEQNRRAAQGLALQQQRKIRGEIFDRSLVGFPSNDLSVRIKDIRISPTNVNVLEIFVEFSLKKEFLTALEKTVEALSFCRWTSNRPSGFPAYVNLAGQQSCVNLRNSFATLLAGDDRKFGDPNGINAVVCFSDSNEQRCYVLQPGDYCRSCALDLSTDMVMIGRFIDLQGQSADKSRCISANVYSDRKQGFVSFTTPRARLPAVVKWVSGNSQHALEAQFDTSRVEGFVHVDANKVDLARAKRFVAVPAVAVGGAWLISLVKNEQLPQTCEQLLDEAVQRYMMSSH